MMYLRVQHMHIHTTLSLNQTQVTLNYIACANCLNLTGTYQLLLTSTSTTSSVLVASYKVVLNR